jgi:hypothetical protein
MATTKRGPKARQSSVKPASPKAVTPSTPQPVTDLRTHERRERVLELWGKPTRLIAKILLEEGYEVDAGPMPVTSEKQEEWTRRRGELMRRNVDNDRAHWEEKWRERAKVPKTSEDLEVELESQLAAINSDIGDIAELLTDAKTKSSAKAILYQSKLRARELILKARGIDQAPEREPEDPEAAKRPTIVVYDLSKCSDEVKERYGGNPG